MEKLVEVTRATHGRLLFDLNLQLRFGQQWDPSNAIELMHFLSSRGYGENIDWELGNGSTYL
jgi:heparanase 1